MFVGVPLLFCFVFFDADESDLSDDAFAWRIDESEVSTGGRVRIAGRVHEKLAAEGRVPVACFDCFFARDD